jgi:hypothetical protein
MSGAVNIVVDVRKREGSTDPSVTALTTMAQRAPLEAAVMRAALDEHYAQQPQARPDLADIAIARSRGATPGVRVDMALDATDLLAAWQA